jgi:hypothetical protein
MAASSALARVLSFRRSLPLVDAVMTEATPIDGDAVDIVPPGFDMSIPATEDTPAPASDRQPRLIVELPTLSQVTLVAGETPASEGRALAPPDTVRDAVTMDAITAIEADIASLLSSMSELSDGRPATDRPAATPESDDDGDDATLTLLSELDRLWQADPMVSAAHQP